LRSSIGDYAATPDLSPQRTLSSQSNNTFYFLGVLCGLGGLPETRVKYSVEFGFVDIVIARRPKADVAISCTSKDRGRSIAKAPHDNAHSFDLDAVLSAWLYRTYAILDLLSWRKCVEVP